MAVSSPPADRVTIIRSADAAVVARPRVRGGPHDLDFSADGRRLWVAAENGRRLVKLSIPGGGTAVSRNTAGSPHDLDVSGRELWVTIDGSSGVEVRSTGNGRLVGRAELGLAPHDLAFEPGTDRVWVSNWSSPFLTVASARSRRRLAVARGGTEPHHFAFGLGCLWASDNAAGVLVRIDPSSRRARGRTRVGTAPHHVAVAGKSVLVAINGNGRVAVVSDRGRLLTSIRAGDGPHGIAAVPVPRTEASAARERTCD